MATEAATTKTAAAEPQLSRRLLMPCTQHVSSYSGSWISGAHTKFTVEVTVRVPGVDTTAHTSSTIQYAVTHAYTAYIFTSSRRISTLHQRHPLRNQRAHSVASAIHTHMPASLLRANSAARRPPAERPTTITRAHQMRARGACGS
eukprot:6350131-Prymnesium_polylepis.1